MISLKVEHGMIVVFHTYRENFYLTTLKLNLASCLSVLWQVSLPHSSLPSI